MREVSGAATSQAQPAAARADAVIELHGLTRRFGDLTAVDHVDASIRAGEIFGLLGRNGAGKTTILKMLTTLLPASSGRASIAGFDVARQAARVRRVIGYVPQALSADGDLTGYENLLVFARLYDVPASERRQRIDEALALMGLTEAAHRLVKGYSGGMIRRLEIAQSTLHRPLVLFLDEPTVGLDPLARQDVGALVRTLQERYGSTILMTTHYLDEAAALCDRIGIMSQGRIAAIGTIAELEARLGAGKTLEDVFARFTQAEAAEEQVGGYADTARARRVAQRVG